VAAGFTRQKEKHNKTERRKEKGGRSMLKCPMRRKEGRRNEKRYQVNRGGGGKELQKGCGQQKMPKRRSQDFHNRTGGGGEEGTALDSTGGGKDKSLP